MAAVFGWAGAANTATRDAKARQAVPGAGVQAISVAFSENMNVRALADQYLGSPDLWPEILKASGVSSITALKPGVILKIPVSEVKAANTALARSLGKIQEATRAGARVFAAGTITKAIGLRNDALARRRAGAWSATVKLAGASYTAADEALILSKTHRDQAAEARLSDRHGTVEGQRPAELAWSQRQVDNTLIEEEKVRTLSKSTAQITFRDASRLRLNANSQAVIQRMRVDPLSRREEAKVNLISGDFYALLGGGQRKAFQVELKNVDARIESGNFWVRQQRGQAKFTNYDDKPVEIASRTGVVTLKRNEGAVVSDGDTRTRTFALLRPPAPSAPLDNAVVFGRAAKLSWAAVDAAQGYWIEIARDAAFDQMIESRWGEKTTALETQPLTPGGYFWRVAALDRAGVPGARSTVRKFEIRRDATPPFLRADTPGGGAPMRVARVALSGETEPGAKVTVAGAPVAVSPEGAWRTVVTARAGDNEIKIIATDPAGNTTEKRVTFSYLPDQAAGLRFANTLLRKAPRHFVTAKRDMTLSGAVAHKNAQILISGADGVERATSYADDKGQFEINLPLKAETEEFKIVVAARSGQRSRATFTVSLDEAAPEITLDHPVPRLTRSPTFKLSGKTEPGVLFTVNNKPVALVNGRFQAEIALKNGINRIEMQASDAVGHVTVKAVEILFDGSAPELVSHSVKAVAAGPVMLVTVEIDARDASGLARVAPVKLAAGGRDYSGHLLLNRAKKRYRGTVRVPVAAEGDIRLTNVTLLDDAGNRRVVTVK